MPEKLNIVIVGAHADDCELCAGGTALRYLAQGHNVTFVVMTDGSAGHHQLSKEQIAKRRYNETRKVAEYLGVEYIVQDNPDGWLEVSMENRKKLITIFRRLKPDVVITHGTNDYHPDHRNTATLVADTAYMVNVPLCVPDAQIIGKEVVYCTISFKPSRDGNLTIIVPIDEHVDEKLKIVSFHESQVFEWLPWIEKTHTGPFGNDIREKMSFLSDRYLPDFNKICQDYQSQITLAEGNRKFNYAEAFEVCNWGGGLNKNNAAVYFPFPDAIII